MVESVLRLSPRIEILPIIHANGDMAHEVRETLIARHYDCLAVPLPESVRQPVEAAIEDLPAISVVVLREDRVKDHPGEPGEGRVSGEDSLSWQAGVGRVEQRPGWAGDPGEGRASARPGWAGAKQASYVPVDPCQAVIMGLRVAMGEGIERAYIDRDVRMYEPDPIHVPARKRFRAEQRARQAHRLHPQQQVVADVFDLHPTRHPDRHPAHRPIQSPHVLRPADRPDRKHLHQLRPRELGRMLEKMLTDADLRERLTAEAREHVLTFDWAEVARETAAIYEQLVSTATRV